MISVSSAVSLTSSNPPDKIRRIRFADTVYNQLYFRFLQQVDHMHWWISDDAEDCNVAYLDEWIKAWDFWARVWLISYES